jgi:hypothetical protein
MWQKVQYLTAHLVHPNLRRAQVEQIADRLRHDVQVSAADYTIPMLQIREPNYSRAGDPKKGSASAGRPATSYKCPR